MTKKRDCLLNPRSYTSSKAQYNGFQSILIAELSLAGVLGVLQHPRNLGVLFTLFQPEGADYAHHISASTPGFENLKTSFTHLTIICISFRIYTIVVVQKNPFCYDAVPFVFLVSFCTCRPLIVQGNLFSKSLFVHHFMKKRIEQNFYMILACFIYFNTEISVMGRTEISVSTLHCTNF